MVSFASLFLGLVFGVVNVELAAARNVARVELLLDGAPVAELRSPWKTPLDLGCEPAPHELLAVAFDADGEEVGRVRQPINLPRATAEASFVLEPGRAGTGSVARLSWRCLTSETPTAVSVTFDGTPVPVSDPKRIELPPYVPERVHFLRATLGFPGGAIAVADAVLGGPRNEGTVRELSAVPVVLPKGSELPAPGEMNGWLESGGRPLDVVAVDADRQEVVLVCEASALAALRRIGGTYRDQRFPGLGEQLAFRFLWPVAQSRPQSAMLPSLYPITRRFTRRDGGISSISVDLLEWPAAPPKGQRIADAVAVAALSAAEEARRRAVVLLLGPGAFDASRLSPLEAEGFLGRLRVPLAVWALGKDRSPEAARWSGVTPVTARKELDAAIAALSDRLDRQRVLWVEGAHLPQSIGLGPRASGVELAR